MEPEIIGHRIQKLMIQKNIEKEELAKSLNITSEELKRKLEGKEVFYINQIDKIKEIFQLDVETFTKIFFEKP